MAKRQRGGARPGQRAPLQRGGRPAAVPSTRPAIPERPAGSLSEDELARAAELEARIVAEEQAAASALGRGRDRRRGTAAGSGAPVARTRSGGTIAATAEEEYRYVIGDLRKIAVIFALIFAILIASWLLIAVTGVITV